MLYHREQREDFVMSKKRSNKILICALLILALIFALTAMISSKKAYKEKRASEQLTELDFNSMQAFSTENAAAVMDALKSGNKGKLEELLISDAGIDEVMNFAKWNKADFKNAVSLGAGSLTAAPDGAGKMDISERFFVDIGDTEYVLFIETLTSRWGRENNGISAIGVTTYAHFDEKEYGWNGEPDDQSVLAGELWWNKQN